MKDQLNISVPIGLKIKYELYCAEQGMTKAEVLCEWIKSLKVDEEKLRKRIMVKLDLLSSQLP